MDEPYGKKDNTAAEQEECDRGTVMAYRSIDMARAVAERKGEARIKQQCNLGEPPSFITGGSPQCLGTAGVLTLEAT
jgi:hypothetical protein